MMPEMDGYTFCRRIKADGLLKTIPFILYTAAAGPDEAELAAKLGAARLLRKPVELKTLRLAIKEELARGAAAAALP